MRSSTNALSRYAGPFLVEVTYRLKRRLDENFAAKQRPFSFVDRLTRRAVSRLHYSRSKPTLSQPRAALKMKVDKILKNLQHESLVRISLLKDVARRRVQCVSAIDSLGLS